MWKPPPTKPVKDNYYTDKMSYHDIKSSYMKFVHDMKDTNLEETYHDDGTWKSPDTSSRRGVDWRFIGSAIIPPDIHWRAISFIAHLLPRAGSDIIPSIIKEHFNEINQLFKTQLKLLQQAFQEHISDLYSPRDEIIKRIEIINQLIDDMRYYNWRLVKMVIDSPNKQIFLKEFKITEDELQNFRSPGYVVPENVKIVI